jgi:hypothetical protein
LFSATIALPAAIRDWSVAPAPGSKTDRWQTLR